MHRDIKPSNILFGQDGATRLLEDEEGVGAEDVSVVQQRCCS